MGHSHVLKGIVVMYCSLARHTPAMPIYISYMMGKRCFILISQSIRSADCVAVQQVKVV